MMPNYYYYATFNAPCVGHKDDESQALVYQNRRMWCAVESVVYTFSGRVDDLLPHQLGDLVVEHDRVESPALVCTRQLLAHRRQEALRVEEARHPADLRPAVEQPPAQLSVPLQQVRVPEPERRRLPRYLHRQLGQLSLASLWGRLIEYQLWLG